MAWYYGTYSCGHEGRENIIGPGKDRQRIADYRFSRSCPDCYRERVEASRNKENEYSAKLAKQMELPELNGSEKQISWANTIRQNIINNYQLEVKAADEEDQGFMSDIFNIWLTLHTSAAFFIENQFVDYDTIRRFYQNLEKSERENVLIDELKAEATIFPEHPKFDNPVNIILGNNIIQAKFEKNDDFIKLMKSLGYKWDRVWEKEICETTGTIEDRAAELGNKLLNASFGIILYDKSIRDNAIHGIFEPECKRWIYHRETGDLLAIKWFGKNSTLYDAARRIRGSKWSRPSVTVPLSSYKEVFDFADMFGFRFTKAATTAIDTYINTNAAAKRVVPSLKEQKEVDKLADILNSSRDIIADLRDD